MDLAAAAARMDAAVADIFDTATVVFRPRRPGMVPGSVGTVRDVNRPAEDDPSRPEQTVRASFWLRPEPDRLPRNLSPDPGVQAGATTISYDALVAVFTAALSEPPRKDDHVAAGGATFRIDAVGNHGLGRAIYYLIQVK